jgi:hypothetical protein
MERLERSFRRVVIWCVICGLAIKALLLAGDIWIWP